jgi:histone acetyltransferase (RNA polymerase elongator complex component)
VEVAFYGGTFLGLARPYRESLLKLAQGFVQEGRVDGIRFSTRPDSVDGPSLAHIATYAVRTVEVGAQSMDDKVLALSGRGHTARDTQDAVKRLKAQGLKVGIQIMPGLPGATRAAILETGQRVADLKPDFVRIYPTVVVKNTVLEKWYRAGAFRPLGLTEAVDVTKELYLLFHDASIEVIRMGLHPSSSLLQEGNVVAGPFHPAFGHLVLSAVLFDRAARELAFQPKPGKRICLKVSPQDVPRLLGHKKENIDRLMERFDLEEIKVLGDPCVTGGEVKVARAPRPAKISPPVDNAG